MAIPPPPPPTDKQLNSRNRISITIPENSVDRQASPQSNSASTPTYSNLSSPGEQLQVPSVPIYRRHSRKRSSQVLIPPVVPHNDEGEEDEKDGTDASRRRSRSRSNSKQAATHSVGRIASGASILMGAQFFAKIITFAFNQALLKFIDPTVFGANAQLELLVNTILYFSREAVRLATQRQTLSDKKADVYRFEGGTVAGTVSGTSQQVVNMGFVPIIGGIPLAGVLALIYWRSSDLQEHQEYAGVAIAVYAIAAVIELLSEPCYVISQLQLEFKVRAKFESIAVTTRCILTFILVLAGRSVGLSSSIIAYACGQLAYSCVLTGLYITHGVVNVRRNQGAYKPLAIQGVWSDPPADAMSVSKKEYIDPETRKLALSLWVQTIFKHCLTEGDKFLVSLLLSINAQGVYAVVVNYGSLLARLVFLPVEETLRTFFSKLLSPKTLSAEDMELSITVFSTILRLYSYLSLFAAIFGPKVAYYFLNLMVSSQWMQTDAPSVLATYTCYIPFLAINGALEAFVQSVATSQDIRHQGYIMIAFSMAFCIAAYVFMGLLDLGANGLVYASMINMLLRILWCGQFIEKYYHEKYRYQWIKRALPRLVVVVSAIAVAFQSHYIGVAITTAQLSRQVSLAMALALAVAIAERDQLQSVGLKLLSVGRKNTQSTQNEKKEK
uniref:Man(5)GlcNAc(2)-PP-dolichol translocation protein RFT1 n=1 Tax=Blastobotrys adeninivorans TaxID=409370 RepID=A0A060TDY1_BLAAD